MTEEGHVELFDPAFVKTVKSQLLTVRRPGKAPCDGELLLIYPVGRTVDDVVVFPVGGHPVFFAHVQVQIKKIVIPDKNDLRAVR